MKTYTIHLIRHGLTQGNFDGVYTGHTDDALCPEGVRELKALRAGAKYPDVPILFSSPLKRCLETAELLYPDVKPLIMDGFIEYNFGSFDGRTAEELKDNEDFKKWLSGDPDAAPPYGESNREFQNRVAETFVKVVDGLLKTGVTESAILTHGGVIMTIMAMFALPEAPMTDWMTDCGCGYTCRITPSLWSQIRKMEGVAQIPGPKDPEEENGGDSAWH